MSPLKDLVTPARLALAVGLVLGGVGVGVAGAQVAEQAPAKPDTTTEEVVSEGSATHPFLLETIAFRATPDALGILGGQDAAARAVALLDRHCTDVTSLPQFFLVPSSIAGTSDPAYGFVPIRSDILGDAGKDSRVLPVCPVLLTVDASVASAAGGHVLTDVPAKDAPEAPVTEAVLMPYTLTLFMGTDAYLLLLVTALIIAVASTVSAGHRRQEGVNVFASEDATHYPAMAGTAALLTGISGTTVNWSELVPTLHMGGVAVVALVSGALVAIGETVVRQRRTGDPSPLLGHLLRVLGTAILSLLPPLILLYGATIGTGSVWVWLGLLVALAAVAMIPLSGRPPADQHAGQD